MSIKRMKYNTSRQKPEHDGHKFDSKREMFRYVELKRQQEEGLISYLALQPEYRISPGGTKDPATRRMMAARSYSPDFRYQKEEKIIVEDVKSVITAKNSTYRLKRQLFLEQYPEFTFIEVY